MFESLIITLREGIEAALVLAIAVAFLRRQGLQRLNGALFAGAGLALVASGVVAVLASRITYNEELAEGIAMLVGAVLVATLVVWMMRAAPHMRQEIESGLGRVVGGSPLGVFLFAFGMVLREGAETAVFLSAAGFTSQGVSLWLGALLGLVLAIVFGILFVRGSLRVPLKPFFSITSAVLALIALQLLVGGLHELSEAQVLPSSRQEMALIGPLVKNELLLFTLTVALAAGWLLFGPARSTAAAAGEGPEARLARAARARDLSRRRWTGLVGLVVVGFLATAFARSTRTPDKAPGLPLTPTGDRVTIDPAPLADGHLHFYEVALPKGPMRLFALEVGGQPRVCLDACEICGDRGYYEDGRSVVCRNCSSPIARVSIGKKGGCNPIPLPQTTAKGSLAISVADLEAARPRLKGH